MSPAFGQFSHTPPSLAMTPFIPLVSLQNVDHLTSRMGQLTSPMRKRGKFNDPVSTPCPTARSLNSPFSNTVSNFQTFDSMKSNQFHYTPQFQTPPPQFQTPLIPHAHNSLVTSSNIGSTWYSKPVLSPRHPKVQRFAPPAINTMKSSACTLSQVECKSKSDEGAKSDTNKSTLLDPGEAVDYSSMFDQFNMKPKVRLYRRFTADQWTCKVAANS